MHAAAVEDCQKSCVSECEDGWEEEGGKCFFFSQDELTWEGAEEECKRGHDSHLASVTDQQIDNFIARETKKGELIWIGARQSNEGIWAWNDCSPWNYTSWGDYYTPGPDNIPYQECVFFNKPMMSTIGTWRAGRCSSTAQQLKYVCSKPICSNTMTLALTSTVASISLVLLIVVVVMVVIIFKRRRRQKEKEKKFKVEKNDLYGLYYTDDGDRIDQRTEFEDQNVYYVS